MLNSPKSVTYALLTAAASCLLLHAAPPEKPDSGRAAVTFSGGHETDPRDRGRPVVLIAAALGVPAEVFREAFTHVRPAPAGTRPTREQERANKRALLDALAKYGVTNERLDEVSNYYRYNRERGETWPVQPATAYAQLKDGKIAGFVVTGGGSGYSSPPTVAVAGFPAPAAHVTLDFGEDFSKNGSVVAIALPSTERPS